ncbi:ninein isoform X1 [Melospiza georgiana]|uniref:ninein isoform X1 n=1 Tax=Melospiza georgiana TaxID=44398 RepID=UPI0025ACEE7B|nr:ninein isoform X1 [Melospiza georgiana]XP_057882423.1 ninein isoform X1 [Melospiza georgiana]
MDEAEQDQYEARLKELFDSFDSTGTGSLGQEELTDLCHVLHLEEVAPALQQTLLQGNLLGRVHFDQFKEALILILSRTLSNEEHFQEPDCSPEAQPKYIKGGKRYGRRSLPEFPESVEDFAEVTVIEPLSEEPHPAHIAASQEHWKTRGSEEYEAEGQLRFWNPDDLNASPGASPSPDWIEEKLQEVCEHLGITRDGHLNRKKLVSICEQHGLQAAAGEVLEEVLHNLEQDGTMSIEDFFYGLFRNGKSLTPSASTPYRQLKRHLSMQSFDESGRRTTTPSAMPSTIGFSLFSSLDDGMGYGCVEEVLDCWHQEGIENSQEILKALDFSLDGKVNLTELTLALENELLITKNGVHQAALASFKTEIRHLLERFDQVAREKEKLRSDLEKAEKLKSLMASEVDDHHAAIERRNEYNLRKLDEEYKERISALKNELRREREQILQQANKQRLELEQEIEKLKTEENYTRDRLGLALKENSRLESELLETGEKLAECESLASKLQRNLENVLAEKFGDLDPTSAEFFLQEERLAQMRSEYEQQCRELQDQIDELHSELQEFRAQGRVLRPALRNSLSEEFDIDMKSHGTSGIEPDQGLGSEDCNPLNMSIEAEMAIEQMKEQHHRDLHHLKQELEDTVSHYEKQLDETKAHWEKEQEDLRQKFAEEMNAMEQQITGLKNQIAELQGEAAALREQQEKLSRKHSEEKNKLQLRFDEEKANLQELLRQEHEAEVRARVEQLSEGFRQEREELTQKSAWVQEEMRAAVQSLQQEKGQLEQGFQEQLRRLAELHLLEKEQLQQELLRKHQQELEEERCEAEKLREENSVLKNEVTLLNEEGSASSLKLRELSGSREEMRQKIEAVRKEKVAVQKMVDNLKKQVADLKTRNQQLDSENTELSQRNSKNQADVQDLNQQLARVLKQKEREEGKCTLEEWEKERLLLKEELENSKIESSNMVSSLEMDLSKMKVQAHLLEQENHILKQELEKTKQLPRCPDLAELQNEVASLITKNEKLQKEKEALSEELNRCIEKVAQVSCLESAVGSLEQEQKSWEQQSQALKAQLSLSQDKVQSLSEALQSSNLQMSRLKSDLQLTQQEKESLEQEVMALHKQLQGTSEKVKASQENLVLEVAVPPSGLQEQQGPSPWGEQELLRQDNERLQREVQGTKTDLAHCREKIRQLESTILSLKHQKHQSQAGIVKAMEQEKLSLKRECEQLQKELSSANRKISQMNSLERELESSSENEGLRKKQVKLDDQLMEMLQSRGMHSQSSQQQGCATVPREQFLQLQQQLLQAERRSQHLQEELQSRASGTNMQQEGHEQLLKMMEERMMDVEQKLRLVKRLLQDKVNQLKEQLSKNTKADAMVKDLYVENAQLLKALEVTEQRQKTAERKNYLLEEKIANLNRIVKNLASPSFSPEIRS